MPGQSKRRRVWTYGSNTLISSLFFLGILVFIALIAERHPWRIDLSEAGSFSLSKETINVLKTIDKPITIKAFFSTAAGDQATARDVLDTYRYYAGNITYEFIDPDRQPEEARRYDVKTYGTLVIEGYGKKQSVQTADEESITNALFKLSRNEQKKIYFLTGHGEHSAASTGKDGYSMAKDGLEKQNYAVADLNLMQQSKVPPDAALVILAGPNKPLFPEELSALKSFLEGGGRLIALIDPYKDGGMRDFLKAYGVQLSDDIVIDKVSKVFGGNYLMPMVLEYGAHKITENLAGIATIYPEARSVQPLKPQPAGVRVTPLASTSPIPNSWAEKNLGLLDQSQTASYDEKEDTPGPIPLLVISEIDARGKSGASDAAPAKEPEKPSAQPKKGYLLVAGCSSFAGNSYYGLSGNGDMFSNMTNYLTEEESLIKVEHREKSGQPLLLSSAQGHMVLWTVLVMVPLLVLLSGLTVYRVRRTQR